MPTDDLQHYHLSFTGASLRPELSRIVAEYFLRHRDWAVTKRELLADNALQSRSKNSRRVVEREIRQRAQMLTAAQLQLLADATTDDRTAIAWLGVAKRYTFVFDFVTDVLLPKFAAHDLVVRPSDYETFVERKKVSHPELSALTPATAGKIRQVLFKMLVEAGLLRKGAALGTIQRPVLSPQVARAIEADSPHWLTAFLVPEDEAHGR